MPYLKWALMAPVMLLVTVLTLPLAFVLPFFAQRRPGTLDNSTRYGFGWFLPGWLSWFQTPDNDLDGDQGWREEHWQWRFRLPAVLATYVGRVGWLWRNPGYGFGWEWVDAPVTGIADAPFVRIDDLWQLTVWGGRLNIGWNIRGALSGQRRMHIASYALSIRFKV